MYVDVFCIFLVNVSPFEDCDDVFFLANGHSSILFELLQTSVMNFWFNCLCSYVLLSRITNEFDT